jgi:molybdopterin converting factor subunit 1
MRVKVRLFAAPREALQRAEIELEVPAGTTAAGLLERLACDFPALRSHISRMKLAVNRRYAQADTELHDNDEVACLPPVGGG